MRREEFQMQWGDTSMRVVRCDAPAPVDRLGRRVDLLSAASDDGRGR